MLYYQNYKSTHNLINSTFINYSTASSTAAHTMKNSLVQTNKLLNRLYDNLSFLKYKIPNPPNLNQYQPVHPSMLVNERFARLVKSHKMESQYLVNLMKYKPTYYQNSAVSVWHRLPIARRSSVLVLLFLGKQGELRVVLTKRSRKLRNFSGHISLPGGKVDNGLETEFECARREMEEEIGINRNNNLLKQKFGFEIEELNTLPTYLARTFLGVSPCVGFINWTDAQQAADFENQHVSNIVLNPGESSSIFSVPLKDFLQPKPRRYELKECLKQSYIKTKWGGIPWNLRSFIFPISNKENEVKWLEEIQDLSSASEPGSEDETQDDHEFGVATRNCWGLTANILHDLAEIIYTGSKHYERSLMGEEDLIWGLVNKGGQMKAKERSEFEKMLIKNMTGSSFKDCLGEEEFRRLKGLYSSI